MESETRNQMFEAGTKHPWFLARTELARIWAGKFASPSVKGIDLGCGDAEVALALTKDFGFEVTGMDVAVESEQACKSKNIPFLSSDVSKLELGTSTQDFVIAMDILEHLPNSKEALVEWCRVLKPGGKLLLTVPAHKFMWSSHDVNNHHYRRYSKKSLLEDIRFAGFQNIRVRWWNSLLFPGIAILRITRLSLFLGKTEYAIPGRFVSRLVFSVLKLEAHSTILGRFVGLSLVLEADSGDWQLNRED